MHLARSKCFFIFRTINGKDVAALEGVKIEDMADGNWTMTIAKVTEEMIGGIKCVATNENGKAVSDADLRIVEPRAGKPKGDEGYPPKFNVPLWDRRVPPGQLMAIECHVDAKPTADIVWEKVDLFLDFCLI